MISTSIFFLVLIFGLLLAFVSISSRWSVAAKLCCIGPVLVMLWMLITVVQINMVTIDREEVEYETYLALPFTSLEYDYQGRRTIQREDAYAIVNLTLDYTLELSRNGATWPFGIYKVDPMTVRVPPGEVGYIPSKIKHRKNANAAYFSLSFTRTPAAGSGP